MTEFKPEPRGVCQKTRACLLYGALYLWSVIFILSVRIQKVGFMEYTAPSGIPTMQQMPVSSVGYYTLLSANTISQGKAPRGN